MKKIALAGIIALAAAHVTAQTIGNPGSSLNGDFNSGYNWAGKSTAGSPTSLESLAEDGFLAIIALLFWAALQNLNSET